MTEQEIRALVRDAIARHTSGPGGRAEAGPFLPLFPQHASHAMFMVPSGADADGPCMIEPTVLCNHCGYCKSYGH